MNARNVIRLHEQYYILASSSRVDDRTRVLKHGETFVVVDRFGDMAPVGIGELGLYHRGTRHLSRLSLEVGIDRPLLLSSTVKDDNTLLAVDLMNPDLMTDGRIAVRRGSIHVSRRGLLWQGVFYERVRLANYSSARADVPLMLHVDADFADIFEVRGARRVRRGERHEPERRPNGMTFTYRGLDQVERRTRIECSPDPDVIEADSLRFDVALEPRETRLLQIAVVCERGDERSPVLRMEDARERGARAFERWRAGDCLIRSTHDPFDDWIERSRADLHLMITDTPQGPYPYAGVPWFSTPFGRDGILTALEALIVNPELARGVLGFLAEMQATGHDDARDAQPGKILHELRQGEMATAGEIAQGPYYGAVDSTPLFVVLAGAWWQRAGDRAFLDRLWPHIEAALEWMDRWGDSDRDGFVDYARRTPRGLAQQGWKDSHDSVFHADGRDATPPIALCEVQAYAWAAWRAGARLAQVLGRNDRHDQLQARADRLRERFEQTFWCEELGTYALAIDGEGRPCRVRTSNPGHCLWTGIASPERARRIAAGLLDEDGWSGWGIRTLASGQARYNPMSYHNGSVWPHDNAIAAAGFAHYGMQHEALRVLSGMFEASEYFDLRRLPELFCGFERHPGEAPTLYPVACAPQAWSAAAPFLLLQACLGLSVDAHRREVTLERPVLPSFLPELRLHGLQVGGDSVDLLLQRHDVDDVGVIVLRRSGPVRVIVSK